MERIPSRSLRPLLLVATLFAAVLTSTPHAFAHAVLVKSNPSAHQVVHGSEIAVELTFNSRVDASQSSISLVDPKGAAQNLTIAKPLTPEALASKATGLVKGNYILRWQALSSDGHISRGQIPFEVQ
jgi:methionine-rich copper-binding protein CopC